jgi:hypothetical protein
VPTAHERIKEDPMAVPPTYTQVRGRLVCICCRLSNSCI